MALAHELQQRVINWRPLTELDTTTVEPPLRNLITVVGSLTRSLRELCQDDFRLRLIGERPANGLAARVREVLMLCGDTPWVFAQTVIPDAALLNNRWLNELGDRPLGDTLFEHGDVERLRLRFAELPASDPLFQRAIKDAGLGHKPVSLWARSSALRLREHELSVNEVFMPALGRSLSD